PQKTISARQKPKSPERDPVKTNTVKKSEVRK
ncbi:MAG: hypothetical protein UU51_C0022G0008, partial [Microgenomates group bacterium GW2011_GWC1_41_20]